MDEPQARLNELDKEEMWDVARSINPEMTRERFEQSWAGFVAEKERRARLRAMQ